MNNKEKYRQVFMNELQLKEGFYEAEIVAYKTDNWDSVGHMSLVTALEDAFDIMLDAEDILDFDSYIHGIEILKKYEVEI